VQRHVVELDLDDMLARPAPSAPPSSADMANPPWVLPASPPMKPAPKSLADTYPKPVSTPEASAASRPVPLSASPFIRSGPSEVRKSDASQSDVKKTISAVSRLGTKSPFVRQISSAPGGGSGAAAGRPGTPRRVSSPLRHHLPFHERSDAVKSDADSRENFGSPLALKLNREREERESSTPLRPFAARRKSSSSSLTQKAVPTPTKTTVHTVKSSSNLKQKMAGGDEEMRRPEAEKGERDTFPGGFPMPEEEQEEKDEVPDVEMREVSLSPVTRKRANPSTTTPRRSARLSSVATRDTGPAAGETRKTRRKGRK
jgi:hypothetical protein